MDKTQENMFQFYGGALLFTGLPHEKYIIDDSLLLKQVKASKAMFARYYTDSQLITPPVWAESRRKSTSTNLVALSTRRANILGIINGKTKISRKERFEAEYYL